MRLRMPDVQVLPVTHLNAGRLRYALTARTRGACPCSHHKAVGVGTEPVCAGCQMAPAPSFVHHQNFDYWDYNTAALLGSQDGSSGVWYSLPAEDEGVYWRNATVVKTIDASCQARWLDRTVTERGKSCFKRCPQPTNASSVRTPTRRTWLALSCIIGAPVHAASTQRNMPCDSARVRYAGLLGRLLFRNAPRGGAQHNQVSSGRDDRRRGDCCLVGWLRERRPFKGRLPTGRARGRDGVMGSAC